MPPAAPVARKDTRTPRTPRTSSPASAEYANVQSFKELARMPRQSLYRPAKPLSYELANHSKAYLEAGQYANGYSFLNALLTTGTSISTPAKPHHAHIPPAPQLTLASSLIAYPALTTRGGSREKLKGADAALRYLQTVCSTISPLNDTLRSAFLFPDERTVRRGHNRNSGTNTPSIDPADIDQLSGPAANSQGLYNCAVDFWHIVGWAFNCSITSKRRWERWRLWLQIMLDFLEAEWDARLKASKEADREAALMQSVIWQYIASEEPTNRSSRRRIIKAIFAMATEKSMILFPEVWTNELSQSGPTKVGKAPDKIDIEKWELGGVFQEDDTMMDEVPRPSKATKSSRAKGANANYGDNKDQAFTRGDHAVFQTTSEAVAGLGGHDALTLRQRLLTLIAQVARALPSQFTRLNDLFDSVVEVMNYLPTIMFSVLLSTSTFPGTMRMAFAANVILPLTSGGELPDYTAILPHQSHLENLLLPRRASTQSYASNAKMSLTLEQIFMNMLHTRALKSTPALRSAVECGIQERLKVFGSGKGKKGNAHEESQAKTIMESSSQRLLGLLEALEVSQGIAPQPLRNKKGGPSLLFTSSFSELSSPPESDAESREDSSMNE